MRTFYGKTMYRTVFSKAFRRAIKRLSRSIHFEVTEVQHIVALLAAGQTLHERFLDHPLTGSMKGLRECHVKNDLLLVYQIKKQELVLLLIDLGSHQDVFRE